jgi:hypothetical protein
MQNECVAPGKSVGHRDFRAIVRLKSYCRSTGAGRRQWGCPLKSFRPWSACPVFVVALGLVTRLGQHRNQPVKGPARESMRWRTRVICPSGLVVVVSPTAGGLPSDPHLRRAQQLPTGQPAASYDQRPIDPAGDRPLNIARMSILGIRSHHRTVVCRHAPFVALARSVARADGGVAASPDTTNPLVLLDTH